MWSNWAESAKASVTQALEKTGDALSKAATQAGKSARAQGETAKEAPSSSAPEGYDQPTIAVLPPLPSSQQQQLPQQQPNDILNHLSKGWSSVVETTRASMKQAEAKVKEQQILLQDRLAKTRGNFYKRDPSLPLDVEALKDAEVVYMTDRIITMGHPAMASQVNDDITGERKLAAVGHLLTRRHEGRFMVWNLSEIDYDIDMLEDQVLTFSFPGSPSPPLGLLLKLLISMESWMKADNRNVAVVHCLTGKGRTSTVLAAFLCWMGEAQFSDIYQALEYIASCKQITVDELTIPSQRRYASYFKNMLDGVRPSQPPLMLKRIIMSEAPRFATGPPRSPPDGEDGDKKNKLCEDDGTQLLGCVPYLQIFKAGKLLHTAPASLHFQQAENELPFCQVADGSISFHTNLVVQGDILVRARHLAPNKKRVSMFRAAFHTGYAPPNVMRLTKAQLDGACSDDRFPPDFFLDFIFEPVDAEEASKLLNDVVSEENVEITSSEVTSSPGAAGKKNNAVQAAADDTMLHRDSRFWDVIATRMKENAAETDSIKKDLNCGPTVGRRREFSVHKEGEGGNNSANKAESEQERHALESFSIGGEFDFLPEVVEPEPSHPPMSPDPGRKGAAKPDSLLEALLGALDDSSNHEVVVFDNNESSQQESDQASLRKDDHANTDRTQADNFDPSAKTTDLKDTCVPTAPGQVSESKVSSVDDMQALMADATMNLDADMEALLAGADAGGDGLSDDDLLNLDMDDAELEDFESFLSPTSKP